MNFCHLNIREFHTTVVQLFSFFISPDQNEMMAPASLIKFDPNIDITIAW